MVHNEIQELIKAYEGKYKENQDLISALQDEQLSINQILLELRTIK